MDKAYVSPVEAFDLGTSDNPFDNPMLRDVLGTLDDRSSRIMRYRLRRPGQYAYSVDEVAYIVELMPLDIIAVEAQVAQALEERGVPKKQG